ncbi:hypothetical protein OAS86_02200 [Gammaproteobacteria bacterium]|nr:hypothetical protein [Gammaproteobacteria bacterium]
MNSQNLRMTQVFLTVDLHPQDLALSRPGAMSLLQALILSPFDARSRSYLKQRLSEQGAVVLLEAAITELADTLDDVRNQLDGRLSLFFDVERLDLKRLWGLCSYLVNYDPRFLYDPIEPPAGVWSEKLLAGDASVVNCGENQNIPALLLQTATPRYIRFASVSGWTADSLEPAALANKRDTVTRLDDDMVIVVRWKAVSPKEQAKLFNYYKDEIARSQLRFTDVIQGKTSKDQAILLRSAQQRLDELDAASEVDDTWALASIHIAVPTANPDEIRSRSTRIDNAFSNSGISLTWENALIPLIWSAMLPTTPNRPVRQHPLCCTSVAALLPVFTQSSGTPYDSDIQLPALYTFRTRTRSPYFYLPWSSEGSITAGIGPTGSGKSFLMKMLALAFGEFNQGIYRALDVDDGGEPVAELYRDMGGAFRIDKTKSFNPFTLWNADSNKIVSQHVLDTIAMMVRMSGNNEDLTNSEKNSIEEQLTYMQREYPDGGDPELFNFQTFVSRLQRSIQQKIWSFIRSENSEGLHANLWGGREDAIGQFGQRFGIFNLSEIKDQPEILKLVMTEIMWRVFHEFQNPMNRGIPKLLDIDEAHIPLSEPTWAKRIEVAARTLRKDFGHISLFTQSPYEMRQIANWNVIRGATNQVLFFADPEGMPVEYEKTFDLSMPIVDTIQSLQPRKEVLVYRPRTNEATVLQLITGPYEHALLSSHPRDRDTRRKAIAEHGFDEGLRRATDIIERRRQSDTDSIVSPTSSRHVETPA